MHYFNAVYFRTFSILTIKNMNYARAVCLRRVLVSRYYA